MKAQFISFRPRHSKATIASRAGGNISDYINRLIDQDLERVGNQPDWEKHFARKSKTRRFPFGHVQREER
jgi:hypothetical protein